HRSGLLDRVPARPRGRHTHSWAGRETVDSRPGVQLHHLAYPRTMAITTARSGLATVNGIELWYEIHGDGSPLVLLHGGFGSIEMFGPTVDALAAGRQVIGVELQSHGRSPAVDRP